MLNRAMFTGIGLLGMMIYLTGCNKVVSAPIVEPSQVLDVAQYSKMPLGDLLDMHGEPIRKDEWLVQGNSGETYPATSYTFEIEHIPLEFIVIDNAIVRLSVLNLEHDEYKFTIDRHEDLLPMIGITPGDDLEVLVENSVTARYTAVNKQIDDVWATLDCETVDLLRVTFDSNYFGK